MTSKRDKIKGNQALGAKTLRYVNLSIKFYLFQKFIILKGDTSFTDFQHFESQNVEFGTRNGSCPTMIVCLTKDCVHTWCET